MIFVISGPSGCGKSTLIERVLRNLENVRFSVSHTTRKKRKAEVEGKDYHFVSHSEFEEMIRNKAFVEWASVHGHNYGTSRAEVEGRKEDVLLDIDIQGARQIRAGFEKIVTVFIMPPFFAELRKRLLMRKTESAASIAKRLADARLEIQAYREFDFIVINEDLEAAVEELKSIIVAARCRPDSRQKRILAILRSFAEGEDSA